MRQRRNKVGKAQATKLPAPQAAATEMLTINQWAQRWMNQHSADFTQEEQAILAAQIAGLGQSTPASATAPDPTKPIIVNNRKMLKKLAGEVAVADDVVVDLETSDLDPDKGVIAGIGIGMTDGTYYIPVNHLYEETGKLRPGQLTLAEALAALRLEQRTLINHNVKFEIKWLRHHGKINCRFIWDTMIAARLLRADQSAELKDIAVRELDVPDWGMSKADIKRIQFIPIERVAAYCAKDCFYTLELYRRQKACLA